MIPAMIVDLRIGKSFLRREACEQDRNREADAYRGEAEWREVRLERGERDPQAADDRPKQTDLDTAQTMRESPLGRGVLVEPVGDPLRAVPGKSPYRLSTAHATKPSAARPSTVRKMMLATRVM